MNASTLVQKIWKLCRTFRDDGVGYGDSMEPLTSPQITTEHPAHLTKRLRILVQDGFLESDGTGRGIVYFLPWQRRTPGSLFDPVEPPTLPPEPLTDDPPDLRVKTPELRVKPAKLRVKTPEQDSRILDIPSYQAWNEAPSELQVQLVALAQPIRSQVRARAEDIQQAVLLLCQSRYLGRDAIAHALDRNADNLLKRTLKPMVALGLLKTAHAADNDPRQAYTSAELEKTSE